MFSTIPSDTLGCILEFMRSLPNIVALGMTCRLLHILTCCYIEGKYIVDGRYNLDRVVDEFQDEVDSVYPLCGLMRKVLPTMLADNNPFLNQMIYRLLAALKSPKKPFSPYFDSHFPILDPVISFILTTFELYDPVKSIYRFAASAHLDRLLQKSTVATHDIPTIILGTDVNRDSFLKILGRLEKKGIQRSGTVRCSLLTQQGRCSTRHYTSTAPIPHR